MKKTNLFVTIFIFYVVICMAVFPAIFIKQALRGLNAWALNVLPSVLPFIFFTKVLSSQGYMKNFSNVFAKPMQRIFKAPAISSYVFFMSIISGYPVGAKMTADLYTSGQIKRSEALKMCSFTSTSGPMFIIGAVGVGMLGGAKYGYIIFAAHVLGAILNGLLYRNIKIKELPSDAPIAQPKKQDLGEIVTDASLSIISVGTIICVFFVIIHALSPLFNLLPSSLVGPLEGLIEITKGCIDISATLPVNMAVLACSFVISFGGISTCLQSLTMLNKLKMPIWLFVLQKFTHAIVATIICALILLF